ncbi:MAG: hypothetical protein WKG07_24105 [Hymenobacter sp.]
MKFRFNEPVEEILVADEPRDGPAHGPGCVRFRPGGEQHGRGAHLPPPAAHPARARSARWPSPAPRRR